MENIYIQLGSVLFYKDRWVQNMNQVNLGCNDDLKISRKNKQTNSQTTINELFLFLWTLEFLTEP